MMAVQFFPISLQNRVSESQVFYVYCVQHSLNKSMAEIQSSTQWQKTVSH